MSLSAAHFIACNLLAAFAAIEAGSLLAGQRHGWRRALHVAASYLLLAQMVVFVCGLSGTLFRLPVLIVLVALAVLLRVANRRRPASSPPPSPARRQALIAARAARLLLYGLCGLRFVQAGFGGTTFRWDDLSYHGAEVARWLAEGGIGHSAFSYQTYYPLGSHLLLAWFMLPFGDDSLSTLTGLLWLGLAVVAIHALCRDARTPAWLPALVSALLVASPAIWSLATSFAAVDLAVPALLLAALALAWSPVERAPRDARADLIVSGLLVGLAVGSRATAVLPALVVLAWWIGASRGRGSKSAPVATVLIFAAAACCTGAWWYLSNWLATGNPLFPAEVGPFAGPFERAAQVETKAWPEILAGRLGFAELRTWWRWPAATAAVGLVGYLAALVQLPRRGAEPGHRSRARLDLALLAMGGIVLATAPFVPFSGSMNRPDAPFFFKQRFVLLTLLCGLLLFRRLLDGGRGWALAAAALAAAAALQSVSHLTAGEIAGALAMGGIALAIHLRSPALASRARELPWGLAACALLAVAIAVGQPGKAARSSENIFAHGAPGRPVGRAWQELERLPAGSRLAFFTSDPSRYTHYYPLFGRALQHLPVAVSPAGEALEPLHRRPRAAGTGWWHAWERTEEGWRARPSEVSRETLLRNLGEAAVDFALVSRWRGHNPKPRLSIDHWPPQQELLRASASAREIYNDGFTALWDLRSRTSVVLISIDTLRSDHLSGNGHARETTPYLDRLALEGAYCPRAFAQSSWTLPSMLSMFSSLDPAVFGIEEGVAPIPRTEAAARRQASSDSEVMVEYFSDDYTTLTEVLAQEGYRTAGFSTNGHLRVEQGFAQGFETFDQESCMWGTADCVFADARSWLDGHLEQEAARPFFLWVHLFDPHFDKRREGGLESPLYRPAPGYETLFGDQPAASLEERTRLAYDRKIRFTDDQIALFVEGLRTDGLLDRVVLAVAVDHGEEFNEKGRWGHSRSLTNSLVQVPLIFRFPQGAFHGVVDAPVRNMDLAPTLLDALGLPARPEMRGTSLMPAFRGEAFEPAAGYGETRRFGLDLRFLVDPARDRKLVLDLATGKRQLYSLGDVEEQFDLAQRESETAAAMDRDLRALIAASESLAAPTRKRSTMKAEEIENLRALGYID